MSDGTEGTAPFFPKVKRRLSPKRRHLARQSSARFFSFFGAVFDPFWPAAPRVFPPFFSFSSDLWGSLTCGSVFVIPQADPLFPLFLWFAAVPAGGQCLFFLFFFEVKAPQICLCWVFLFLPGV